MGQGLLLTVIGMGTVFVSLFALAVLMRLLDWMAAWRAENGGDRPPASERGTVGASAENPGEEDLFPVVAAAVGAYLEAQSAQVFLIPVERPDRSRWVMDGRVDALSRADALATEKRS
ncbi:MAG: OadG family protein [Nitrospinota bacterium]|jgi:sodium pump decarboxylase gamma subunit|nr:OadG family protein [Nitrospinota bacterium]